MKIIQQVLELRSIDYYIKYISIVNVILPLNLTTNEIKVLAYFILLRREIIDDDMFNTLARKRVMEELNLTPGGLSNYLKFLLLKKALNRDLVTRKMDIKEFLIPENETQGFQIKLVKA